MTKRTRTILFIICVFFFLLAVPCIVLYSQGYRYDFNPPAGGKRIVQTGAFYFKVLPKGAEIYLNEKFENKTSILTNSILVENLLPKNYEVEIKKTGFYSWQKTLEIKEKQVTDAKNIILFPEDPNFTISDQKPEIEIVATSSDKKKVVDFNDHEIWILFLESEPGLPKIKAGDKVFLTRFSEKIDKVFWLTNHYLIFNAGDKIKIAEIDPRDKVNIIDLAIFENPKIFWDQNNKKFYVLSNETLYVSGNLLP